MARLFDCFCTSVNTGARASQTVCLPSIPLGGLLVKLNRFKSVTWRGGGWGQHCHGQGVEGYWWGVPDVCLISDHRSSITDDVSVIIA